MIRKKEEEVGDLFVTEELILLKLLPSNKSASKRIKWFADGAVKDPAVAAKDVAKLVDQLKGRSRIVRGLTLMTHYGMDFDAAKSGLHKVISKAGYRLLN